MTAIPREMLRPEWLTAVDAAALLGISTKTLKRRTDAGLIGCSRDGRNRYYLRAEVEQYRQRTYTPARVEAFPVRRAR